MMLRHFGHRLQILTVAIVTVTAIVLSCKSQPKVESPTEKMDRAVELRAQGRHEEAIAIIEELVRENAIAFGFRSWQHVEALHCLAKGRADMWQFQQADSAYFLAETILSKYFDADSALAELYWEHGIVKSVQEELDLADELFEKSYELFSRALGPCDSNTLKAVDAQAGLEIQRGKPENAIPHLEQFLKCRMSSPSGVDLTTFQRAQELLLFYAVSGRDSDAEQFGKELLAQDDSIKNKFYPPFCRIYSTMSDFYRHAHQLDLAQSCLDQGIMLTLDHNDSLSNTFVWIIRSYGDILNERTEFRRSGEYYERAHGLAKLVFGSASDDYRKSTANLAKFYRARGNEKRALEIEQEIDSK